jgi:hypothetical protein
MCHTARERRYWAVGKRSLPCDIDAANQFDRRIRDQIEMVQDIRSRVGNDRDIAPDMNWRPDLLERGWPSPAGTEGKRGFLRATQE